MDLSHDQMKELIAPFLLGAVSPEEERQVQEHLASCDECQAEAASLGPVTRALPLAVTPAPIPPSFVDSVVSRVHADRPALRSRAPAGRWWRGWQVALGGALLVIALALGGLLINAHRNLDERQRALAALLQHQRGGMDLAGPSGVVAKVIPMANGSLFVAAGLHEPPADHTYQLWLIKGSTPVSAGTFTMQGGVAILKSNLELQRYEKAAVTIEPAGGSKQPTTQPIIISR